MLGFILPELQTINDNFCWGIISIVGQVISYCISGDGNPDYVTSTIMAVLVGDDTSVCFQSHVPCYLGAAWDDS